MPVKTTKSLLVQKTSFLLFIKNPFYIVITIIVQFDYDYPLWRLIVLYYFKLSFCPSDNEEKIERLFIFARFAKQMPNC